jgi:hypothetical protein
MLKYNTCSVLDSFYVRCSVHSFTTSGKTTIICYSKIVTFKTRICKYRITMFTAYRDLHIEQFNYSNCWNEGKEGKQI